MALRDFLNRINVGPISPITNATNMVGGFFNRNQTRQLPNNGGSYQSPTVTNQAPAPMQGPAPANWNSPSLNNMYTGVQTPSALVRTSQPTAPRAPAQTPATGTSMQSPVSAEDKAYYINAIRESRGDIGNFAANAYANPNPSATDARINYGNIENTQMDVATGELDPYEIGSKSGISYSPEELGAIEKAMAGVYDPAIESAKATYERALRMEESEREHEQNMELETLKDSSTDGGNDLELLLSGTGDPQTQEIITQIYGSNLGTTATGKRILSLIQRDPNEAKRLYRQLAYGQLTGTLRDKYTVNSEVAGSVDALISTIDQRASEEKNNNPYLNFWQQNGNYVFNRGDQSYKNISSLIGSLSARKINELYGAALTPTEEARAMGFIPDLKKDSLETIKTKLVNLKIMAEFAQDVIISQQYGAPRPNLSNYLNQGGNQPKEYPGYRYDPSTNTYEQVSFNQVGGDTNNAQSIANAIKQVESSGNYNARGGSGEFGAYQFMPKTWSSWATKYLGNANAPMTQANQDAVAMAKINELLSQGYGAREIALIWNGGEPKVKKGVNRYGVAYDSGAYANKILSQLS